MLAFRLAEAMSFGYEVSVELRDRKKTVVRGTVSHRLRDAGKKVQDKDDSNLTYVVGGRSVELVRVGRVRRLES